MKKNNLIALLAIVVIVFSSCSNEEISTLEDNQTSLLKTYKVKRDATGAYSVDFDVSNNTKVERFINADNNSEYLLSSSNVETKEDFSQDLEINDSQLKISFVEANTNKKSFVSVIDDNIKLQRKGEGTKLADYSIQGNEDGTFNLDFSVNANVAVSFVYNEEISTYEIHLEDGIAGDSSFSRVLERVNSETLNIDFVNHNSNPNAKSSEVYLIRKPKVILGFGDEI
jgi:hypothetical protein